MHRVDGEQSNHQKSINSSPRYPSNSDWKIDLMKRQVKHKTHKVELTIYGHPHTENYGAQLDYDKENVNPHELARLIREGFRAYECELMRCR